jgi:hypothetical protein
MVRDRRRVPARPLAVPQELSMSSLTLIVVFVLFSLLGSDALTARDRRRHR